MGDVRGYAGWLFSLAAAVHFVERRLNRSQQLCIRVIAQFLAQR